MLRGKAVHCRQGLYPHVTGFDLPARIHKKIFVSIHVVFKINIISFLILIGQYAGMGNLAKDIHNPLFGTVV